MATEKNRLKKVEIRIVVSAAIRAGYSKKTAASIGEENLRKPEIQASRLLRNVKVQGAGGESLLWAITSIPAGCR